MHALQTPQLLGLDPASESARQAGADGGPGAAGRVEVVVEDADDVGSGQGDPQLEGKLRGVRAVWQLAQGGVRNPVVVAHLLWVGRGRRGTTCFIKIVDRRLWTPGRRTRLWSYSCW